MTLKAEELTYSYDGKKNALDHISFELNGGEYVSILGANGSGKSTLLKVIDLILPIKSGCLTLFGITKFDKKNIKEIRRRIAFVFQNPDSAFIENKVLDEVMFSSLNFGIKREDAEKSALSSLSSFALSGYEWREIKSLSSGEKQRLNLASAFSLDPDIIILDEAFTFLDSHAKMLLCDHIFKKQREGKLIISVTHSAESASRSDRIILMRGGRIIKDGKSSEILSDTDLLINSDVRPRDEDLWRRYDKTR